jgi:hypothetical protein
MMRQQVTITPQPGQAPIVIGRDGQLIGAGSPQELYRAAKAQRSELGRQMENLQDTRRDLVNQMQQTNSGADKAGLEKRITEIDQRISDMDKSMAAADAEVAKAAGVPGAVVPDRPIPRQGPPEEVYFLSGLFMVVVLFPLAIASARRMWRRGAQAITQLPVELYQRLTRLEQAVDAIAVEIERVGEGQRFMSRLFSEDAPRVLGQGAAQPIEVAQREAVPTQRR